MDGYSPQRLRNHPRDNRTLQPRSERCRRKGKSHDHGKSQGDYCGIQTRQKALDRTSGNGRLPQKSQSNKRSRKYALRTLARHGTESVSSQNHRINCVCLCSKGKAHEARHPFAQGNHDRIRRRHESIQGMGFDKGRYRCVKGCGTTFIEGKTIDQTPATYVEEPRIMYDSITVLPGPPETEEPQ